MGTDWITSLLIWINPKSTDVDYFMRQDLQHGVKNWKTDWGSCCCSSSRLLSKPFIHSPHLCTPFLHFGTYSSGSTWLLCSVHQTQIAVSISREETWQTQCISGAFSSPVFYWVVVSLNCSPEDYGKKSLFNARPWIDPIRKDMMKMKRLCRKGMESSICMHSYI